MANWLKKWFGAKEKAPVEWPAVDLNAQVEAVRAAEAAETVGLGRLIHRFEFHEYELRLDRDITGMYRLMAMEGEERRYSFSIRCEHKDYKALQEAYEQVADYLSGERRIAGLPNSEMLKGHYYGHVEM